MKIWTYAEMKSKILRDCDLEDETFINTDEMAGYFNEALNEAESEIIVTNQDYLLTKAYVPVVQGTVRYDLPYNIYANKIRTLLYNNGARQYEIPRFRRKNKFLDVLLTDNYGDTDDYMYLLVNDTPGQAKMEIHPAARENAILYPVASIFAPFVLWYIRNCARIPMLGEYCNPEVIANNQVNVGGGSIQTYAGIITSPPTEGIPQQGIPGNFPGSILYVTGDAVKFQSGPDSFLPAPLVDNTVYYVIAQGSGVIKLATTRQNAIAGTAIALSLVGQGYFTITVACTTAIRDATLIDIPEFATFIMQWVKCRCFEKESDPRLQGAAETLTQQKKQMVDTLTIGVDDDDDTIQADFSHYDEMS